MTCKRGNGQNCETLGLHEMYEHYRQLLQVLCGPDGKPLHGGADGIDVVFPGSDAGAEALLVVFLLRRAQGPLDLGETGRVVSLEFF